MKFAIIGVVVVLAAVVACGVMGIIPIPGLSPEKKKSQAAKAYAPDEESPAPEAAPLLASQQPLPDTPQAQATPTAASEEFEIDPYTGQKKLAKVWGKVEPAVIAQIVKDWSEDDLARQLFAMPPAQAGELLTQVAARDPKRASSVSKKLQKLADDKAAEEAKRKAAEETS
jgi:hypothetical protein